MTSREAIEREVADAEARLAALETTVREGGKVTDADLDAAGRALRNARLRLDGLPELERRAAEAEDKARAEKVAEEHETNLRETGGRLVELVKAASEILREIPEARAAYRDAVDGAYLDLRPIRRKPEGFAVGMGDDWYPGPTVTLHGTTWAAPHALDIAVMLEPIARALPYVGKGSPASSLLRSVASDAHVREHPVRGTTYPVTDALRKALGDGA
jgi:hypothetical protein